MRRRATSPFSPNIGIERKATSTRPRHAKMLRKVVDSQCVMRNGSLWRLRLVLQMSWYGVAGESKASSGLQQRLAIRFNTFIDNYDKAKPIFIIPSHQLSLSANRQGINKRQFHHDLTASNFTQLLNTRACEWHVGFVVSHRQLRQPLRPQCSGLLPEKPDSQLAIIRNPPSKLAQAAKKNVLHHTALITSLAPLIIRIIRLTASCIPSNPCNGRRRRSSSLEARVAFQCSTRLCR